MSGSEDYFERQERKRKVLDLMEKEDWRGVLREFDSDDKYREPLLVWIRPSLEMLSFVEATLLSLGISKVTSIGCGCGVLEWLLSRATKIQVRGIEVNKGWWESSHSTPHYIPLDYTEPGTTPRLDSDSALLFCYFNHLGYFEEYLANFGGNCLVIIGPIDGKRHCEPEPGYLESQSPRRWNLVAKHDVRSAREDCVSVYERIS